MSRTALVFGKSPNAVPCTAGAPAPRSASTRRTWSSVSCEAITEKQEGGLEQAATKSMAACCARGVPPLYRLCTLLAGDPALSYLASTVLCTVRACEERRSGGAARHAPCTHRARTVRLLYTRTVLARALCSHAHCARAIASCVVHRARLRGAQLRAQPLEPQRGGLVAREGAHRRRHSGGLQRDGTGARLRPSATQAGRRGRAGSVSTLLACGCSRGVRRPAMLTSCGYTSTSSPLRALHTPARWLHEHLERSDLCALALDHELLVRLRLRGRG